MEKEELIRKECETWSCWNDLDELEQDEVTEGYGKIYDAGLKVGVDTRLTTPLLMFGGKTALEFMEKNGVDAVTGGFQKMDGDTYESKEIKRLKNAGKSLVRVVKEYHECVNDFDPEKCETCAELEGWE